MCKDHHRLGALNEWGPLTKALTKGGAACCKLPIARNFAHLAHLCKSAHAALGPLQPLPLAFGVLGGAYNNSWRM